eukprot:1138382-Pelagomonas_calceolata.AAC.3
MLCTTCTPCGSHCQSNSQLSRAPESDCYLAPCRLCTSPLAILSHVKVRPGRAVCWTTSPPLITTADHH